MASSSTYQAVDAVVSSNFSIYSASLSRARGSVPPMDSQAGQSIANEPASERDLLLGGGKKTKKPFYRPRPLWLVPFAIVASIVRGMTLAPRVQVYTQLSCNAIYGHDVYDHTSANHTILASNILHAPSLLLDPLGPALHPPFTSSRERSPVVLFSEPDDDEPDPRLPPSKRCLEDPAVQAGAVRLQTMITITMGMLSAITTVWWGNFGERHGRTRVLAIATMGLLMTDLVFILVSTPHSIFAAHGHKFLIISPIIEGLLGGWSTLQAATSAYISDCTSDGSRAHIFSRFTGVFYLGFAVGPTIGAFLIRHPFIPIFSPAIGVHNGAPTVTSVFYVAATASFVNLLLALFLFPESLEKKKAKVAAVQSTSTTLQTISDAPASATQGSFLANILSPLAMFLPKSVDAPDGRKRTDWSMTLLAMVLFGHLLSLGLFQIKYLYAEHIYGWGAEQLSYYISAMGFSRALHLLFILPFLIATFKPKPKPAPAAVQTGTQHPTKPLKATPAALAKEMHFDLSLIRGSLLLDLLSHTLVTLSPANASQGLFVGATAMSSFAAGLVPATNSLALCIMQARGEDGTGKLFGAFSVLQAVGQTILGPILFGIIYSETVAKYPKAIFAVAAGIIVVAIAVLCLIRPDASLKARRKPKRLTPGSVEAQIERRGRPRASKDLRRSSAGSMLIPSSGQSAGASSYGSAFFSSSEAPSSLATSSRAAADAAV
ncbi:major facilitator superfamily domain-containing protein [Lenzites betulinus]|nr:major facilitator superfamily domain-containing protein [Lenzites betulinus]